MANQKEFLSEFKIPTYEEWKEAAIVALKGAPFEKKLITSTYEDVNLQPIYNEADRDKVAYLANSLPGEFPFNRGICSSGYKSDSWDVAQTISCPLPSEFNKALLADLECGQDAVSIQLCECNPMFGNMCCDEETTCICHSLHIGDLVDMEVAFANVDLTAISIYFLPTCPVSYSFEVATLFYAYCRKHNINIADVKVNFGFDFLTSLAKVGKWEKTSPKIALDEMAALIENGNKLKANKMSVISIDGTTYHNAGCNAIQEIAYSVATAVYYIKELLNRGLNIDDIARNIHFNFGIGVKFFIEIAKIRAARVIWAKIIKEFGGSLEAQKMVVHAFTSKIDKTVFDAHVNILRCTTEGFSAIMAGANSITISPFDETLGLASDFSRRVARNIQSILKDEAHMNDTIDPVGGSYYIETLTDEFVNKIWELFRNIEKNGGMFSALKSGIIHKEIADIVEKRNKNISTRKDVLLGTNKYPNLNEKPIDVVPENREEVIKYEKAALARKKSVDAKIIYNKLAFNRGEAVELAINSFLDGAHIVDIWKAKDTEENNIPELPSFRAASLFENLRNASIEYKNKNGKAPQLYFANFGTLKQFKARADFSTDFFAVAGFEINQGAGYATLEDGINDIKNISAPVVVICSTDDIYPEVVPGFAVVLKQHNPNIKLILAGLPKDYIDSFKEAGVDEFIHIKSNVYETLFNLMKEIGIF